MRITKRKIATKRKICTQLLLFITLILLTQQILELLREKTKLDGFWNCHESGKSRIKNTHLRVQMNVSKFTPCFKPLHEDDSYSYLSSTKTQSRRKPKLSIAVPALPYLFLKIGELSQSFDKTISEAFSRLVNLGSCCTEKTVQ